MKDQGIRVGLVVVASPLEVGADKAPAILNNLKAGLDKRIDAIPYKNPVMSSADSIRAGQHFYDNRIHAICAVAASWFEDYLILDMLEECDVPVVLWGIPGMETGSLCGTQQLGFMLKQLSKPYTLIYDDLSSESSMGQISKYTSSAALRSHLRKTKIGYLGHRVEGMTETTAHELALKKIFGPRVVNIDTKVFWDEVAKIDLESAQYRWEEITKQVGKVICSDESGIESLRIFAVLRSIVEERMLDSIAIGCYPHLMGKVCLSASLLGEDGIPVSCEGDINGALGMMILSWLSSEPIHNTDLLNPVPDDNAIIFSHCGSGGFSLAKSLSDITLAPVRLMDQGLCCMFTAKPGPVTLINIVPTISGYRIAVIEGDAMDTDMVFPGNPLKVRFEKDYREVLSWIADNGLGHHWMAAYGHLESEVDILAEMIGCEILCF